jgi:predicted aconitase with swiveling domain
MSDQPNNLDRLFELVGAVCDGSLSPDEFNELDSILRDDRMACDWYRGYCRLHGTLRMHLRAHRATQAAWQQIGIKPDATGLTDSIAAKAEVSASFPSSYSASLWHGTLDYCSSAGAIAYLLATIIVAVGLAVLAVIPVSRSMQVATYTESSVERQPLIAAKGREEIVGRITGMVDCQWKESEKHTVCGVAVSLGQSFALRAGLLEITYDSGAKVILQGPVTYEVDSAAGGYLSAGKLTARLTKGARDKAQSSRTEEVGSGQRVVAGKSTSNQQPASIPNSLFAIRTPTTVVTDLGTEFGVEVTGQGNVETIVFSGKVIVTIPAQHGREQAAHVLNRGQSVRVVAEKGVAKINNGVVCENHFVRSLDRGSTETLIDATKCNGSFEEPAVGPKHFDPDAGNLTVGVYAIIHNVVPRYWDLTSSIQTKGTFVRGVTGEQYVVLQDPTPVLKTCFDGIKGHPETRKYEPHTVYVLAADLGANTPGVEANVSIEAGEHIIRRSVIIDESDRMRPMPVLEVNTDRDPKFVGMPITVRFARRTDVGSEQLYVDNVTLKAISLSPATTAPESKGDGNRNGHL